MEANKENATDKSSVNAKEQLRKAAEKIPLFDAEEFRKKGKKAKPTGWMIDRPGCCVLDKETFHRLFGT